MEVYALGGKAVNWDDVRGETHMLGGGPVSGLGLPLTAQILATVSQMSTHSLWAELQNGSQARSWTPWCFNCLYTVAMDAEQRELRCAIPNIHLGPEACKQL